MGALTIPERFRAGIIAVGKLEAPAYEQLVGALEAADRCDSAQKLASKIAHSTAAIPGKDRQKIIASLASMYQVRQNAEVPPEVFAEDVWDALLEEVPEQAKTLKQGLLRERIARLIPMRALDLASSRISDVRREYDRSFCGVRIFTDLRTAFGKNPDEASLDTVIVYSCQIGYDDGMGKHHEVYLSMDAEDLESFAHAINEAQEQTKSLEKLLEKGRIRLHK